MGNHECSALLCLPTLVTILNDGGSDNVGVNDLRMFADWVSDGGSATVTEFMRLSAEERLGVFRYIKSMSFYEEVSAGGNNFVLVHAGLCNFSPKKKMSEYKMAELDIY